MMPGVAGVAGAHLDDDARAATVVVAAGEQRRPGRAAKRRGVELVVDQPVLRELVEMRRRHRPAERRTHAEADIVEQDEQHVRRSLRSLHRLRIVGRRVLVRLADLAFERGVGLGQLRAIGWNRRGRVSRLRCLGERPGQPA